ncbi:MAG: glycyl radical protein [Saprospiraceae bacterium]|nr:glycyl radical protein [Saprospiraceae bacterium]
MDELHEKPWLAFPAEMWGCVRSDERLLDIKKRLLDNDRQVDLERARLTTESYRETEGKPMPVRRAKMLLHLVRKMSITIYPDEKIVGDRSLLPRMGVIAPEGAVDWVNRELDILPTRPQDQFTIEEAQIRELREDIFPYWQGKTLEDAVAGQIPAQILTATQGKVFSLNQTDHAQGHILPDVESWLQLGIAGLREKVQTARAAAQVHSAQQQIFYEAALIALQAAQELISRYADLALEMSGQEKEAARKEELSQISSVCAWVSKNSPRSFWEAGQLLWFLFVLLQIESNASSFSPGRFDQYMRPTLDLDLKSGRLNLTEAQRLLEFLWLKFNQIVLLRSSSSARYFAGFPIGFNIILGGQTADGSDATNYLSYMCLRAQTDLGLTQPNLSIRIHRNSPQTFLMAAVSVIGLGSGMPQVFNDEVIIPGQIRRGIEPADARNYGVVGCVELSTPGKALGWSDAAMFNMTRVLELTLFGGKDPQSGMQIGLPTLPLDSMPTFEALEAAYDQQMVHFVRLMVEGCNIVDGIHAKMLPSPFLSLVVNDCISRGMDVTAGGAHYNFSGVQGVQIANVADSLAAIKQMVFDAKSLPASQLLDVLKDNFKDQDVLRQKLINRVPKYGNDDEVVDCFSRKWADRYCELVSAYSNRRGGIYLPGFYTVSAHVPMGANVGATPDGRYAGQPLADGGLSPSAGRDLRGPTAVFRSVSKANLELAGNGTLLNMKFLPSFFASERALEKFVLLLRGFSELKIPHVQFNVISSDTLRDAQKYPENYRSLVVRVAGYSAYFTELDRDLQDEIIRRTEFS